MCRQRARPYLFSNAMAPVIISGVLKAFEILKRNTELRDKLEENARYWRKGLTEAGFILKKGDTPIVPVMLFNAKLCAGFLSGFVWRRVFMPSDSSSLWLPKGQARIRTQLSAGHEKHHLDKALEAFIKIGKKYKILGKTESEIIEIYGM